MALSGSLSNAFRPGYRIQIDWSATQDVGGNTSTVTAHFYLISTGSSYNINASAAKTLSIVIDGTTYSYSVNVTIAGGQTKYLGSASKTIGHNADGSRAFGISGALGLNVSLSGTFWGTVTIANQDFALNAIPRASTPTLSAYAVNMGSAVTIYTNWASSTFTHTLVYNFGAASGTIATGVGASFDWTIPLALADYMPNGASGALTITCYTYSGGTHIGTAAVALTAVVPANIIPTISAVTISEAVAGIATKFVGYVQNKSKLNVKITSAGAYSSTIKSYDTKILGITYLTNSFTSGVLTAAGTVSVVTTVTDSRGRTASVTNNVTVIEYNNPTVTTFNASRCNASGATNNEGTSLLVNMNFAISSVNSKNDKTYKIEYKRAGTETWNTMTTGNVYKYNNTYTNLKGLFSVDYAYSVRLTLTDFFGSSAVIVDIPTAFTLLDFNASGRGLAIGQVSNEDGLACAMPATFTNKIYLSNADKTAALDLTTMIQSLESGWVMLCKNKNFVYASTQTYPAPNFEMQASDITSGAVVDVSSKLSVGMKLRLTQDNVTKYFFVVKITATVITLYGGTDYSLTDEVITNVCASVMRAPYGFPMERHKWRSAVFYTDQVEGSGYVGQFQGVMLDIPIGSWDIEFKANVRVIGDDLENGGIVFLNGHPQIAGHANSKVLVYTRKWAGGLGHVDAVHITCDVITTVRDSVQVGHMGLTSKCVFSLLGQYGCTVLQATCNYL